MNNVSGKAEYVSEYYGKHLQGADDFKTNTCSNTELLHPSIAQIERQIDNEILSKYYGCGSPIPAALAGCTVLDIGCGTGRDAFVASRLAGPEGSVIGIDMTEEQISVAEKHLDSQMQKFGYTKPNVRFSVGRMEDLRKAGIDDNSVDVVISNCVINLSGDKEKVFSEIFRVLKPGGELCFSDVFAGRRVPEYIADDPLLFSECLGGAMYLEDFRRMLREKECPDYRIVKRTKVRLNNPEIEAQVGMVDFYSMTVRAFKLDDLEDICEDYGQVAVYRGTIPGHLHVFELDDHHRFIAGKPMLVCGNTASMLRNTRYAKYFKIYGDRSVHYGPFDCAPAYEKRGSEGEKGGACC